MSRLTPDNIGSCDTMVSLGAASARGNTVFGKNSDRPADETQPLEQYPRESHEPDADSGCQFVRVPQAALTHAHVGSRPYWCRGYEHGFNEHQVVIGNEAFPTNAIPSDEPRLIGMELVRLGLERGSTAAEAVETITSLTAQYGQGKFNNSDGVRTYDNLFIVADPADAYIVETVEHDWAVKRISGATSISNVGSIRSDWDSISAGREATGGSRADWGAEVADWEAGESGITRQCRSSALLSAATGSIGVQTMISVLSDHSLANDPAVGPDPLPGEVRGICTHTVAGGLPSTTAASLVADLCSDGARLPVYWCNLYSPCTGLYLPVFTHGRVPAQLGMGGRSPSADSPWWTFYTISQDALARGPERVSEIRAAWAPLQERLFESADGVATEAAALISNGHRDGAAALTTEYMNTAFQQMMGMARSLSPATAAPVI